MKNLSFNIQINASPERVWKSLWEPENYKVWTKPFCDGSYYKTNSFTEGNRIHLLSPQGDGMYSILDKVEVNKHLAFKHLGELLDFKEIPITEETQKWSGALETYTLHQRNGGTEVEVNVETLESYEKSMLNMFPLALDELKKLAEG